MKYEISKNYFNFILFYLIEFREKCRLNTHIDIYFIKDLDNVINMVRYYRQFGK